MTFQNLEGWKPKWHHFSLAKIWRISTCMVNIGVKENLATSHHINCSQEVCTHCGFRLVHSGQGIVVILVSCWGHGLETFFKLASHYDEPGVYIYPIIIHNTVPNSTILCRYVLKWSEMQKHHVDTCAFHYNGDVSKHDIIQNPGTADRSTACWRET